MPDLRSKLQTALGDRYRISRELTGGGMSRIYLAEDRVLEREVVVKVLAPDLVDEERIGRFRLEVLQTARMQHPTIVPVIEVGAIEDTVGHHIPYYVMPYVRGESLRSRMQHDGRLSIGATVRILRNVFDALACAHAYGVIHRDLKPENIFLAGTSAVLADFGIAKAITGPGAARGTTQPGVVLGTPTYMAPEQLVDAENVGPSSDLYAAGVVAYEMLAGRVPWSGRTPTESLAAQAQNAFTPLRAIRTDVPPTLAALVESCLGWDPATRPESAARALTILEGIPLDSSLGSGEYGAINSDPGRGTPPSVSATYATPEQAARGFATPVEAAAPSSRRRGWRPALAALGVVATAAIGVWTLRTRDVTPRVQRLTVLAPELPATVPNATALRDQLLHLLTAQLSPVSGLRLLGQVSVQRLFEASLTSSQVADTLRAQGLDSAVVIVGTPQRDGTLALRLELRTLSGTLKQTLAGPLSLRVSDSLPLDTLTHTVRTLAGQAVARLSLSTDGASAAVPRKADAFVEWLMGREQVSKRTPEGFRAAIVHFEKALQLDSTYAQASSELSNALALSVFYRYRQDDGEYVLASRALALADRAVTLRPDLGDGSLSRALIGTITGAPVEYLAEHFGRADRLSAGSPFLATFRAGLFARQGRWDDALALAEAEVRLDPRSAGQRVASALYSIPSHQFATTVRNGSVARSMLPDVPIISQMELLGRLQLGGSALADCPGVPAGPYLGVRALCLERTGAPAEGKRLADSLEAMLTGKAPVDSTYALSLAMGELALYHAAHGEREAARQWIRQAFLESPSGIDFRVMRSGFFDPSLIALADSLQTAAWARVVAGAQEKAKDR